MAISVFVLFCLLQPSEGGSNDDFYQGKILEKQITAKKRFVLTLVSIHSVKLHEKASVKVKLQLT